MYDNIDDDRIKALAQFLGLDDEEAEEIENSYGNYYEYGNAEYFVGDDDEAQEEAVDREISILEDVGIESLNESYRDYVLRNFCTYDWESVVDEMNRSYAEDIQDESDDEYGSRLIEEVVSENKYVFDDTDGGMYIEIETDDNTYYLDNDGGVTEDIEEAQRWLSSTDAMAAVDEDEIRKALNLDEDDNLDWSAEFDKSLVDWDAFIDERVEQMNDTYSSIGDLIDEGLLDSKTLKDYIDFEAVAEDIVDTDGRGFAIAGYDGEENEEDVDGETYYIYRTN